STADAAVAAAAATATETARLCPPTDERAEPVGLHEMLYAISRSTTTHARGTFYPPTGVPPSGPAASMPRQQQQATSLQSIRGSGSGSGSGGAGRYSSTSGAALRPPPPPPPPPLPFSGGLSGRPPSVTNSTRFQCGPGASTETIPTEPAYIDAFVKDQLTASSMARTGNIQQLQHHQQSQQQRSPIATTGTAGKPADRVEKMNQMFTNFAVGGGQKPSTLSPSQKQQQHTRDPTMDAAAAAVVAAAAATGSTFRPQTAVGEARTSDAMHRYQLAYQQQQQWQQQMQQLQRFLQAATPQQQQQVMMMLFSQIQQQQQQQ
ncbi:unnamed protein product, partial [Taenia asiatica]|uniref:Uncharacterized protein n=1 Tax=Taenia asiatica TaxID=60517 RepID=A0A0R3W0E4_TAEAS